jgi:hypothetical protein
LLAAPCVAILPFFISFKFHVEGIFDKDPMLKGVHQQKMEALYCLASATLEK